VSYLWMSVEPIPEVVERVTPVASRFVFSTASCLEGVGISRSTRHALDKGHKLRPPAHGF
jgi:hypothetical protein